MNEPGAKILDLVKRMMKLSTSSNMSISEVATAHYHCLASLALEAAAGDLALAEKYIRGAMEELVEHMMDPAGTVKIVVQDGKVVGQRRH
jgi:hypothetical protein